LDHDAKGNPGIVLERSAEAIAVSSRNAAGTHAGEAGTAASDKNGLAPAGSAGTSILWQQSATSTIGQSAAQPGATARFAEAGFCRASGSNAAEGRRWGWGVRD
jgi:hypothetical protein